jgi:hypothetical protein
LIRSHADNSRETLGNRQTPTFTSHGPPSTRLGDPRGQGLPSDSAGEPLPALPLPFQSRLYLIGPPQRAANLGVGLTSPSALGRRLGFGLGLRLAAVALRLRVGPGPEELDLAGDHLEPGTRLLGLRVGPASCLSTPVTRTCRPFLRNCEQSSASRRQTSTSMKVTDWPSVRRSWCSDGWSRR